MILKKKKFFIFFVLCSFSFLLNYSAFPVKAKNVDLQVGDLMKVEGVKGSPVYEYGADGEKHVYMDEKTYKTWHDDFSEVQAVTTSELDQIPDGQAVTARPGAKLITHSNTAKVYAVGEGGVLYHVPSEKVAEDMYGEDWNKNVTDIDPGVFSATYVDSGKDLAQNNLPDGTVVSEAGQEQYYMIDKGTKRPIKTYAYGKNRLDEVMVASVTEIPDTYQLGIPIKVKEERITNFTPEGGNDVEICHQPSQGSSDKPQTITVAESALAAHLAHGDTQGKCPDYTEPVPVSTCQNVVMDTRKADGGTYWQNLGLDTSTQTKVSRYRIQWFSGSWSPWYTKGVDDIDWKDPNRRVWSYFDDHAYQIEWCQPINDDISDVSCANGVTPVLVTKPADNTDYWESLGLDISSHPEIKKYKIRWFSGAWSPTWYVPGVNDVDWALSTRRVWSYFDDHEYKYVYCPESQI